MHLNLLETIKLVEQQQELDGTTSFTRIFFNPEFRQEFAQLKRDYLNLYIKTSDVPGTGSFPEEDEEEEEWQESDENPEGHDAGEDMLLERSQEYDIDEEGNEIADVQATDESEPHFTDITSLVCANNPKFKMKDFLH